MNIFHLAAAMFGAAGKASAPPSPRSSAAGAHSAEEECTPCAANAYAESVAQQSREMFGTARPSKKGRRR